MDKKLTMYDMKVMPLNSIVTLYNGALEITRVPGGWIYKYTEYANLGSNHPPSIACVFIPDTTPC